MNLSHFREITLIICAFFFAGCMSSKISFEENFRLYGKPSFEDYFDYYALGFIGQNEIDVQKVCLDQKPRGVQKFHSFEDGLIGFFTLGIYTPITVRVWCKD